MRALALTMTVFLWALSPLFAATSIQRVVEADDFLRAGSDLGQPATGGVCGGLSQDRKNGDSIRITADERGARRDDPAVSFLLDAHSNRLLVVDHTSRTFSELAVPLKPALVFPYRASLDKEARQVLSYSLDGPVREVPGEGTVTYQGKLTYAGRGFEGILTCRPTDGAEARSLVLLEQAVQQLRNGGNDWISLLPTSRCLILSLEKVDHQPEVQVRTRERLVKIEETDASKLVLTPPEGYRKVAYRECSRRPR